MKKTKLLSIIIMCICLCLSLAACGGGGNEFTVTFNTGEGGSVVATQTVKNGKKVDKPTDPTNLAGDMFVGWRLNTAADTLWKFESDIVTANITLTAKFIPMTAGSAEVKMTDEAFSNTITWLQAGANNKNIEVSISGGGVDFVKLEGEKQVIAADAGMDTVKFIPTSIPVGGVYFVKIASSSSESAEVTTAEGLVFKGEGSEANPYLVYGIKDITAVVTDSALQAKSFKQMATIVDTLTITHSAENKLTFNGLYDGNGNTINVTGNGGLFFEVGTTAIVKGLTVAGDITAATTNNYAIGGFCNTNLGTIDNCISTAKLTNENGVLTQEYVTPTKNDNTTGAGGISGVNKGTIKNCSHSGNGTIKARIGNGSMAAFNYGTIANCSSTASLPAGNQVNSGKGSADYSFIGGMAGFNYGEIKQCINDGRVFAQAAVGMADNVGKQKAIGGIVGYNGVGGTVTECVYQRNITVDIDTDKVTAKEFIPKETDSQDKNNLGCASTHGDTLVGGLAGVNDGSISYSYVKGAIIGGRTMVAGLVAKSGLNSTLTNCYAIAIVTLTNANGPTASGIAGSTIFSLSPVEGLNNVYVPLTMGNAESKFVPTYTNLTAAQIAVLNTGAVKFAADGTLVWQA